MSAAVPDTLGDYLTAYEISGYIEQDVDVPAVAKRLPTPRPGITALFYDPNLVEDTRVPGPGRVFWCLLAACCGLVVLSILQGWVPI